MPLYQIHYILFVLLVSLELARPQKISIENNGYRHIKVFLPSELPSTANKTVIVNAVKDLLSSSSLILYIATKRRAHFAEVTLVVPNSWGAKEEWLPDNSTVSQRRLDFYNDVDVEISSEMEGTKPFTLHTGGCGEQAARIYMPLEFLTSEEVDVESKSKEFVHHWAQYRYGLFPEGGFPFDSRYPLYYSIPGTQKVEVTDCTDTPLNYTMWNSDGTTCASEVNTKTGRPENPQCAYTSAAFSPLQSSIMYQQHLIQMSQFCHGETELDKVHNVAAPSKHNTLCGEDSTWFVIIRSKDFLKGRNQASIYRPVPTGFKYVQQSSLRVVVVLETSAYMNVNSRYSLVKNALAKFVLYDLPSSSKFGLVSYSDEEITMDSLVFLDSKESRQDFLESLPFEEDSGPHFNKCVTCAIEAGAQLLENDEDTGEGGIIILIAAGSCENPLDEELKQRLMMKGMKIFVMLFSEDQYPNCAWETYSSPTGGRVHHIPESVPENSVLTFIYLTFSSIVKGYSLPLITEVLLADEIQPASTDVSLPFQVDSAIGNHLRILITGSAFDTQDSPLVADATNIKCGFDEEFTEFERQRFMPAWVFDIRSHQGSNCTFETRGKEGASDSVLIFITQKWQDEEKPITVHATLNHKNQTVKTIGQFPLKIFISIRAGVQPIIGAEVVASAYHPNGDTSELRFIDDGVGDPDVTMNDGIYSTYFTNYSTGGHYSFVFKISSKEDTRKLEIDTENCCGSFVPYKKIQKVETFTRLVGPMSIFLSEKPPQEDVFPPNQILDVRVSDLDSESRKYTFQWTAAGDDYNQGSASSYQMKVFADRTELRYDFENRGHEVDLQRDVVLHTPAEEYGKLQEFVIQFPSFLDTGTYYFGVRAVDDAGNYGLVSNNVPVFIQGRTRNRSKNCDDDDDDGSGPGRGVMHSANVYVMLILIFLYVLHP